MLSLRTPLKIQTLAMSYVKRKIKVSSYPKTDTFRIYYCKQEKMAEEEQIPVISRD